MKNLATPLTALIFGIAVAFAGFNLLRGMSTSNSTQAPFEIGQLEAIQGMVERRLPLALQNEPVKTSQSFYERELVITHRASAVTVTFQNGSAIRIGENSRLVAERDATRTDALVATVIEGTYQVISVGKPGTLRLFQGGIERPLTETSRTNVPKIRVGQGPGPTSSPLLGSPTPSTVISATTTDETTPEAKPTPPRVLPKKVTKSQSGLTSETLTNEEITRQLRSQTGFFQRCYLTFLNRKKATQNSDAASPGGTVTLGFTIQPNGKTTGVKVVRSDFQDATLKKCVSDVVSRTSFKTAGADSIPVLEFPITLK